MIFVCYPKCTTCQKAQKWLDEHNIRYSERHIANENPTLDELKDWRKKRTAAQKILQYERTALQRNASQGQTPLDERGRTAYIAFLQRYVGKASYSRI